MNILDLSIDHVQHIASNLDVVSFIFLLSTCKQLFQVRKALMRCHGDEEKYQQYDEGVPLTYMMFYSYINILGFKENSAIVLKYPRANETTVDAVIENLQYDYEIADKCKTMLRILPKKVDLLRVKNTFVIMGYHCFRNPQVKLHNNRELQDILAEFCCKAVCRKYNYKYSQPYHKVVSLFSHNWHESCVNMVDMCEIAYHIKNRKYNRLYETLWNMKFAWVDYTQIHQTIDFLMKCVNSEDNNIRWGCSIKYKAIIICMIYMYIQNDIPEFQKSPKFTDKFKKVIVEKSYEHMEDIGYMLEFPKYLRNFMINTIRNASVMIQDL